MGILSLDWSCARDPCEYRESSCCSSSVLSWYGSEMLSHCMMRGLGLASSSVVCMKQKLLLIKETYLRAAVCLVYAYVRLLRVSCSSRSVQSRFYMNASSWL